MNRGFVFIKETRCFVEWSIDNKSQKPSKFSNHIIVEEGRFILYILLHDIEKLITFLLTKINLW